MDEDELLELNEDFEFEISKRMLAWENAGIDRRGVMSGPDGGTVKKVTGYVNTDKSRKTFEKVMAELEERDTVESVIADPKFLPITKHWPMALARARNRLDGSA